MGTDDTMTLSRRRMTRLTGLGLTTTIAGCLGVGTGSVFGVGDGGPYQEWLTEPDALLDRDHASYSVLEVSEFYEYEAEFDEDWFDEMESSLEELAFGELDADELSRAIVRQPTVVLFGSFDIDDVIEDIDDDVTELDDEGDYEGYTVYTGESREMALGVREGVLVIARNSAGGNDAEELVEIVIDTKRGDEPRYVDESEDFDALVGDLGGGTALWIGTYEELSNPNFDFLDDIVGNGYAWTVDGPTTELHGRFLFEDDHDVDTDAFEEWHRRQADDGFLDDYESVRFRQEGRTLAFRARIDTDDLSANTIWVG